MKNLIVYYCYILVPFGILIWLSKMEWINPTLFVGCLLFYALVYRTYTDGKRLAAKKVIPETKIWKLVIPGTRIYYFKELYLK
ncbi:hypothetical protein F0365_10670 [Nonlabens sp. Ci31]|jgi:hypothetical protein|uniref:hypothetical protein n=1 Tax=Nonlabens sp. Ci31 TaxID=2608253 RepID=UPI001463A6FD|nr:hypothetical protein [Nonlabens sp. Ci31]QJP34821.1 hypothetical protein F0365_10670 [Nonlabens sp. Ci31]